MSYARKRIILLLVVALVLACQVVPTPPALQPTSPNWLTPQARLTTTTTQSLVEGGSTPSPVPNQPAATKAPGQIQLFPIASIQPFAEVEPVSWTPAPYNGPNITLPVPVVYGEMRDIANTGALTGLTNDQRAFLAKNGFVVIHSQETQFIDIRQRVAMRYGQPYYLTSDAAYHALHLAFDDLIKALEREELRPRMIAILQAVLAELMIYKPFIPGTPVEADVELSTAYLGVALRLFDPQIVLDPDLEGRVTAQINQIMAGGGVHESTLIPGFTDDYSAYQPTGHYAGDAELETYFRGMTWLERVHFKLQDPNPNFEPSRVPLIITLALRRAATTYGPADQEWASVDDVLTFLVGSRYNSGPREYANLMDQAYGRNITLLGLADEPLWRAFLSISQQLPSSRVDSTFADTLGSLPSQRGWRFMGQRFTLDAFILQNLVFDRVSTWDKRRLLPSGLDVMAALGSPVAGSSLERTGATAYLGYPEQMNKLQSAAQTQRQDQWFNTAYGAWLYAFLPQLSTKSDTYPPYMRTTAWAYKDMNSALGSWVELKHDTTLTIKTPEAALSGGPPASGPTPGYVEPNPLVFYRLAYIANVLVAGLEQQEMCGETTPSNLSTLLSEMQQLGEQLEKLGDIAAKELAGKPLDENDYQLIQSPIGAVEQRVALSRMLNVQGVGSPLKMHPIPMISAITGADSADQVLETGTGLVDRIYVVVHLEDKLQIAQGGVFSYYEFSQPRDEQLRDEGWRQAVYASPAPASPDWTNNFLLLGGAPIDVLAFRIGDVYMIPKAGAKLNIREKPSRNSKVIKQLSQGSYIMIMEGPVKAEGFTWWKFNIDPYSVTPVEGWAVESQEWYERAWGQ